MDANELNSKMLSALEDDDEPAVELISVSLEEQKQYLERYIDSLTVEDRKDIARVLIKYGRADSITPTGVGSVINLDTIPQTIVNEMYLLAVSRREKVQRRK